MRPCRSKTATEKSWPSRACSEYAVRCTVVPISTAIDCSAPQMTPRVMGSTVTVVMARSSTAPDLGDQVRVVVDGGRDPGREDRGRLSLLHDGRTGQRHSGAEPIAIVDGAIHVAPRLREVRLAGALADGLPRARGRL